MIALWTEIYVRTETAHRRGLAEAKERGHTIGENVFPASDGAVALHGLRHLFKIPENMEVTYVYSAWYQPTLFHEDITKFKTLDVTTGIMGQGDGSGVTLEAQSVEGEDAQINLRVHILCEIQPKRQST